MAFTYDKKDALLELLKSFPNKNEALKTLDVVWDSIYRVKTGYIYIFLLKFILLFRENKGITCNCFGRVQRTRSTRRKETETTNRSCP